MEKNTGKFSILNIGSGNKDIYYEEYSDYKLNGINYFNINLDHIFLNGYTPTLAEVSHRKWIEGINKNKDIDVNGDVFKFISDYKYQFDFILLYRYFEHIPRDKILYFIYLLSTIIEIGGLVDVIAPNYQILSDMISHENPFDPNFEKHDILVSTELFNEINDPHQNITTPERIKKWFEYENRFIIESVNPKYTFDGRDIYFRSIIRRI